MALHVGIDTGGTFTDLVVLDDETGELAVGKRPSTPAAPAQAIFHAFEVTGVEPSATASVTLGATVGTNALLERKGARALFLTTAGFEDVPAIGRIDKQDPYDLRWPKPKPFVARRDCVGVRERLAHDGSIVTPLAEEELERVAEQVGALLADERGDVAIAVSLLFAFAAPAHERRLAAFLEQRFPEIPVSASHRAALVWREHERGSTTVVDAYLKPVVRRLAEELDAGLARRGFSGPVSLGAVPGPACYGQGGTEPTVTDANLVLGRLDPGYFLGGRVQLDPAKAYEALARLGERLGLDAVAAAEAVIEISNEGMASTIRRVAVERSVDPRDFEIVAFGGAGPLHAAEIASSLGMASVIVPPHPGLASAFGTLLADRRVDRRWTHYSRSDAVDVEALAAHFELMERDARAALTAEGFAGEPTVVRSLSMRYAGQNYEREAPLRAGRVDETAVTEALGAFHELHHEVYGYSFPGETIELIHANVTALGPGVRPASPRLPQGELPRPSERRDVRFRGEGLLPTPVYRREMLPAGATLRGPAVVEELDSTTLVLPGQELRVHENGIVRLSALRAEGGTVEGRGVDSVTMSVIGDQLVQIAQEMGTHMMRAAYSPIFSESRQSARPCATGVGHRP